jgi:YegS/Rv2252/BmrU family lipid kinase
MKTIFVVNPAAGQGKNTDKLVNSIKRVISNNNSDAFVYVTKHSGDATEFVKNFCMKNGAARFIACGGDGTLNEVLNGAIGFGGAQVGVIPVGTGNDFCRNFDKSCDFLNILNQMQGTSVMCDAIKFTTSFNGKIKSGYCLNMFNIGFDCNVADLTATMKKQPLISGSFAYFISILFTLVRKKCSDLKIKVDNKVLHNGKLLLTSVANGSFCGGGIKSNPLASVRDGLININIIKNITRLRFISLLPQYMKGTVLGVKGIEKYIMSKKCKKLDITPKNGTMRICIDGEIISAEDTHFEIVPNAFNFVLPTSEVMGREYTCV